MPRIRIHTAHEATERDGRVDHTTPVNAPDAGCTDKQLAETFVCIAPTAFVDDLVRYVRAELDRPVDAVPPGS